MKHPKTLWVLCFFLILICGESAALVRQPNTTLRMPLEPKFPGYSLIPAFDALSFVNPVAIRSAPGETNRIFVVERTGAIYVITNLANPTKSLFLDLQPFVNASFTEAGLTGLAFHPGYQTNGHFYVMRSVSYLFNRLARFSVSGSDSNQADLNSELVLFDQLDPSLLHNAGDLHFGADGYLYVSLGDSGAPPDRLPNMQPLDGDLFGGIIRIDVDKRPGNPLPNPHPGVRTNYAIPADNPFIGVTNYQGISVKPEEIRTEFYAIGLRNPWRFSIDAETGVIYCGDVGGGWYEEINIIVKGGNYGWPYREASVVAYSPAPTGFTFIPPFHYYRHLNAGFAVVGGVVYRGNNVPQLQGRYIFGDYVKGHIWALRYDSSTNVAEPEILTTEPGLAAFGVDPRNGDILVANHESGSINRLIWGPPEESGIPASLAETGAFKDLKTLEVEDGLVPYQINLPFWSDFASKRRWFYVPHGEQITYDPANNWSFPTGTVWIKHFDLELIKGFPASSRRIETRFIIRNAEGVYGATYRWDNAETNALLVSPVGLDENFIIRDGAAMRTQTWHYPSTYECKACHSPQAGYALGFNTLQLNCPGESDPQNQLQLLSEAGFFTNAITDPETLPRLARPEETNYPIQYRARSYLQANCAQCHQPGARSDWDARLGTATGAAHLLDGRRIVPGSATQSYVYQRLTDPYWLMPIIGGKSPNPAAAELFQEWINTLPVEPWNSENFGDPILEGSSTIGTNAVTVSAAGGGGHFLSQQFTGSGQIIARLSSSPPDVVGSTGLMFQNRDEGYSAVMVDDKSMLRFISVNVQSGTTNSAPTSVVTLPVYLKLSAEDGFITAAYSHDGKAWSTAGQLTRHFGSSYRGGSVAFGEHPTRYYSGSFDHMIFGQSQLESPATNFTVSLPAQIDLAASLSVTGAEVRNVQFYSGQMALTLPDDSFPFHSKWTNGSVGVHNLRFKTTLTDGSSFFSPGVRAELAAPSSEAIHHTNDIVTRGEWLGVYGSKGFVIAGHATNIGMRASLLLDTQPVKVWERDSTDLRALQAANGGVAAAWQSTTGLVFTVSLPDGHFHRLTFYFLDWDNAGRAQKLELRDPKSGNLLGAADITNFSGGLYVSFNLRSTVRVLVKPVAPSDAVLSGLFLDSHGKLPPQLTLIRPLPGEKLLAGSDMEIEARAVDFDGELSSIEFFANREEVGARTNPPYAVALSNVLAGSYTLHAEALDNDGQTNSSSPVLVTVEPVRSEAIYHSTISSGGGTWRDRFGQRGWWIAEEGSDFPVSVRTSMSSEHEIIIWENPSLDERALQKPDTDERLAAAWMGSNTLHLSVQCLDAQSRMLSLYFLDYDSLTRTQQIKMISADGNTILDSQEVAGFDQGKYLRWLIRGVINIEINAGEQKPVLSALFLDAVEPSPKPIESITLLVSEGQKWAELRWEVAPGASYKLSYSTNLAEPAWRDLPVNITLEAETGSVILPLILAKPQMFYKLYEMR